MELSKLDRIIGDCLDSIFNEISPAEWRGREREIVSRFCFGYLIKLYEPDYIGLEVAVPQFPREALLDCNPKSISPHQDVCKDIVIWREPRQTAWDGNWEAVYEPIAVMEWTVINRKDDSAARRKKAEKYKFDKCWLLKKADSISGFTGYAVLVDTTCHPKRLTCARLSKGKEIADWLTRGESAASAYRCWEQVLE